MSEQIVYLEGAYIPLSEAKISIMDHGVLYGDGIFEGIRAYNSHVFRFDDHLKRFEAAAKAIKLNLPVSIEEVKEIVLETCRKNNLENGYIRLVCTRGADGLGLFPSPKAHPPRLFCIAAQIALYSSEAHKRGLKVITSQLRR
ncbi:MAG: aminotransferase class IV, partial [Sphaerochaetaceae bacterium]